jgi:hypothetical protein
MRPSGQGVNPAAAWERGSSRRLRRPSDCRASTATLSKHITSSFIYSAGPPRIVSKPRVLFPSDSTSPLNHTVIDSRDA